MKTFKDIYNKRRTRTTKEFVEDKNGDYVYAKDCIYDYIRKEDIEDEHHIQHVDGRDWDCNRSVKEGETTINGSNGCQMVMPAMRYYKLNKIDTIRDTNIVGTALAFTSTLWEYVITNNKLWNWFVGVVTDGYFMIFFSPFILAYWALLIVAYIPMMIILSALVVGAVVWTPILEFPAGYMNKEKNQYIESWLS